ncbi:hypothetical protein [Salipaludibacillus daqingensis]|uniref:hypothetical protein n=1 Tax=Salipaludibacillus daqingensis TaxID=3041001 RepID=UPI0024746AE6|nr:hypothetical protein [Salipaludibacillus daqingensis]
MKEKSLYIGIGLLIGVGIGFVSFSNLKLTNIGNIEKLTVIQVLDKDPKNTSTSE